MKYLMYIYNQWGVLMKDKQLEEIIDLAINREEIACAFYQNLLIRVKDKTARETLEFLSREELKHKTFLERYRAGEYGASALRMNTVVDYHIAEHLEKPDIDKNMETRDIYLVAAYRELASYNFYNALADIQPAGEVKEMLRKIANEELKHKEKAEYLYANTAFPQTEGG
jgi:rubrerythrin